MCVRVNAVVLPDCAASFVIFFVGVRSCMVEESGTLESQLEATKVNITHKYLHVEHVIQKQVSC